MVSQQEEASVIIRDILDNNWDKANTSSIKPKIKTGWWNESRFDNMVTISGQTETQSDGGRTGYFGFQSGNGPVKDMDGSVQVDCWSESEQFQTNNKNAKDVVYEFSEEVKRIVTDNTITINNLRFISWNGRSELPSLDESPTLERQSCTIDYSYYIFP